MLKLIYRFNPHECKLFIPSKIFFSWNKNKLIKNHLPLKLIIEIL